ncbi:hypothetical protein PR202_gb24834 [Eleusine coracana subsp. coracana]|uniref:AtC3H23-like CCCH zinc finger domain-containing protein n=1 Tax=Eleusine coracana subsp. coracana TaxID=191504 RepID=A0AAV5FM12_ELECO|nr:hypothetical protein PR202_gb24834 [Eleusine coracana subsp. coracana]
MKRDVTRCQHENHRLWASMPDGFWVYVYKVQRCTNMRCHDWNLCPYAHLGERARRRDPRRFHYMPVACPDYPLVRGMGVAPACVRGLSCGYAHGVFEMWLHPQRFRTRMCGAGRRCPRKICFFAHGPKQRRREDDVVVPFVGEVPLLQPYMEKAPVPRPVPAPPLPLPRPLLDRDDDAASSLSSSAAAVAMPGSETRSGFDYRSAGYDFYMVDMVNQLVDYY